MSEDTRPMSIDAMLDMERQEVLALLANRHRSGSSPERRHSSSKLAAPPRSPVRSMLDIEEEGHSNTRTAPTTQPPVRSMLDIDSPVPTTQPPVRSMLDLDSPSPPPSATIRSASPASPGPSADSRFRSSMSQGSFFSLRSMSGSGPGLRSADGGLRPANRSDRTSEYQFSGILPHSSGQPRRPPQSSKRMSGGALGETQRGPDLSSLQLPPDRGRHDSGGGRLGSQSHSPHNRWEARSRSPTALSPPVPPNTTILDGGQLVDRNHYYRRLSDANLRLSSGILAQLPMRKASQDVGQGRLHKDYLGPDGEQLGSSSGEEPDSSDYEDRGRKKAPRSLSPDALGDETQSKSSSPSGSKQHQSHSLLAAADQERLEVASQHPQYQYRSLIPDLEVTNSAGHTSSRIHPNTSYDQGPASATPSMVDSDEEADVNDIKRAQNLSFSMTNVLNNAESQRAIRIIYRGEYSRIVQQAEEEHHRLRKYLVATDLSEESTHALEWAIGTVLRDGDTLIAIYCVDAGTGIATSEVDLVPEDFKNMKEQAAAINTVMNSRSFPAPLSTVTELKRASAMDLRSDSSGTPGSSPKPSGRDRTQADEERHQAIQQMTDRVVRLLRKTRLQVRVIVEVLHCKTPRHMVTEVIDLVNPTLVVIGSRGRSALQGVILGSFSNYLVTKSSVPVMVARKRLRKQSKFNRRTPVRQVNNLSSRAARSLANAKVD